MSYPANVWNQLKNITAKELISALEKDGWKLENTVGSSRTYRKSSSSIISIHVHPHKTYGKKLLTHLLKDIGWTEAQLRRLKLIK